VTGAAGSMPESHAVQAVDIAVRGIRLSGLVGRPSRAPPRALEVALHGGGSSAGYWDGPAPGQSFVRLAVELGFAVLAVDRPGYGASRDVDPAMLRISHQVEILFDAINSWSAKVGFQGPVCLIGHSVGGIAALMMAANVRGRALAAVDVMGVPFRYPPGGGEARALLKTGEQAPEPADNLQRRLLFGPDGSFPPEAIAHHRSCARPIPLAELEDGLAAPAIWGQVLPQIAVPVQFTLAEFETMQCTGWDVLHEVRALLRRSPAVRVELLLGSGHNASLHHGARAYHLRALAFFEERISLAEARARR
jgi:pimeloyl-ACP methyl ester carboxylesterase